jgi:TPR repeat protein
MPNVTFKLHKRSAAQGNVASLLAMGDAYFYGSGVELDSRRAASIYYEVSGSTPHTMTYYDLL